MVPCDILTCMESFLSCCDIFLRETWWTVLRFLWTHIGCTQRANWGCGAGPGGVEAPTWRSGSRNKGTESSCHSAVNTRCGQWSIFLNLPWFEREFVLRTIWSISELRFLTFTPFLSEGVRNLKHFFEPLLLYEVVIFEHSTFRFKVASQMGLKSERGNLLYRVKRSKSSSCFAISRWEKSR